MFRPAWFSRRRDMQKVKQKESSSSLLPFSNASSLSLDDTSGEQPPTSSFAQALSLHKAISRARASHLEAELAGFLASRKDLGSIRISHDARRNDMQSAGTNEHSRALITDCSQGECSTHTTTGDSSEYSWPHDALPLFSTAASSMELCPWSGDGEPTCLASDGASTLDRNHHSLLSNKHAKDFPRDSGRLVLCLQNPSNDNDTEDSTILTPDSIKSSFGSESSSVGIFEYANCSIIKGDEPIPADANLGRSSSGAAEISHSLYNSEIQHRHDCCTVKSFDSLCNTRVETSLSLAISSCDLDEESEVPSNSASLVGQGRHTTSSDMHWECNSVAGNSNSGETMLGRILYGKWEENSALIATENPSLVLSSKWQEERVGSCSLQNARSSENSDREHDVCKDGESKLPLCEWQLDDIVSPVSELKDGSNGIMPEYGPEDESNVGFHKSKHDAYIKHGRRHRGSSFSATLPENMQGVVGDSVALVRMSLSPYEDFRQSMYEMIMEQDLEEASMDVEERLLQCYLTLNSPELHPLIKEVFSDVWSSILMSVR